MGKIERTEKKVLRRKETGLHNRNSQKRFYSKSHVLTLMYILVKMQVPG